MENIQASEIFSILFTGINAVVNWFQDYILVGDWSLVIYGSIFFFIFARLILAPLFGASLSGGSGADSVRKEVKSDHSINYGNARYPVNEYDDAIIVPDESIPRLGGK